MAWLKNQWIQASLTGVVAGLLVAMLYVWPMMALGFFNSAFSHEEHPDSILFWVLVLFFYGAILGPFLVLCRRVRWLPLLLLLLMHVVPLLMMLGLRRWTDFVLALLIPLLQWAATLLLLKMRRAL